MVDTDDMRQTMDDRQCCNGISSNFFPGKNLRAARWRREREEVVRTWSSDRLLRGG